MLISVNISDDLAVSAALDCALTAQAFDQPAAVLFLGKNTLESAEVFAKATITSKLNQLNQAGYTLYYERAEDVAANNFAHRFPMITLLSRQGLSDVIHAHTHCISF